MTLPPPPAEDDGRTIDPRIRQRRVAIQRSRGRRRLHWIIGVVAALALVAVVVALLHSPWFSARVVTVTGNHPHTSDAAIVAAAGLGHRPLLISVDPGATALRVEGLPFIASAQIHRHWPDGVQISVTERAPVMQMAGPGSSWSLLDGHGRSLQVVSARTPALMTFVVHSIGATLPPARVGASLPAEARGGLDVARSLPPAFAAQVVSVTVAADGTIGLALNSGITVILGTDSELTAKYEAIAAIVAHGTLHSTSTIDVSVPESPTVSG